MVIYPYIGNAIIFIFSYDVFSEDNKYYPNLIENISQNPALVVNTLKDGRRFWKLNNEDNMKIDAIIGNPPYQVMDGGGAGTSAISVYNLFVDIARKIKPSYISMIMPARWYSGGKGLDDFRVSMLQDTHIQSMYDYPNPKECFPTANISGGVCYFLWSVKWQGKCNFTNIINGERTTSLRKFDDFDVFVRYNRALPIIEKVKELYKEPFMDLVYARNPFNLDSSTRGKSEKTSDDDIIVVSSRGKGYMRRASIQVNEALMKSYKVFMGKVLSGHIGETDENGQVKVIATIQEGTPNMVSTDSYLVIGPLKNELEVKNAITYMKTKTFRFLLLQSLTSMNISRGNFRFVPAQDFSLPWTDTMLYSKYNLSQSEIEYIESMIRKMD